MEENKFRIGITMRVTDATGYSEKRDSLAHDWTRYLARLFPNALIVYLPNIGDKIVEYYHQLKVNAIIFSGGENIGTDTCRDLTESALLRSAQLDKIPVLGVCRGLQVIYTAYGGSLKTTSEGFRQTHVAARHPISIKDITVTVNSYHANALNARLVPDDLKILAFCKTDNSIEAVSGDNILGIMWHPEREESPPDWETEMIRRFLSGDSNMEI